MHKAWAALLQQFLCRHSSLEERYIAVVSNREEGLHAGHLQELDPPLTSGRALPLRMRKLWISGSAFQDLLCRCHTKPWQESQLTAVVSNCREAACADLKPVHSLGLSLWPETPSCNHARQVAE